jgi:hypothetical protein
MRIFGLLLVLGLVACVGDIYQPAASPRGVGWRDTQIEPDRYRITFTGTSSTDVATVQDLALLRAAELTLNRGRTWFRVVSSDVVAQDMRRSGRVLMPYRTFGGFLIIEDYDNGRIVATLEIVLGQGPKPEGDARVYDAQVVANTIRARMK